MTNPAGTAEAVLAALGLLPDDADRAAIAQCVAENAREGRPRHKYSAAEFSLSSEGIARDFAAYHARYLPEGQA